MSKYLPIYQKIDSKEKRPNFWRLGIAFLIVTFFSHWLYTATKECTQEEEIVSFYASQKIKPLKISNIQPLKDNYLTCHAPVSYKFDIPEMKICDLTDEDILRYAPLNGYYRRFKNNGFDCNMPQVIKDVLIDGNKPLPADMKETHEALLDSAPFTKARIGYFFALIIDNEHTAEWTFKQLVSVIQYLSPNDVYLSIFDNGYNDGIRDIVTECRDFVKKMNLGNFHIMLSPKRRPDMHFLDLDSFNFNDLFEPFFHFYMDPNSKPYGTDHVYMKPEQWTELKNIRLPPTIDKVVLIKNQYFCASQVLELIFQSFVQEADAVTPMLVSESTSKSSKSLKLADNWNFRDLTGNAPNDVEISLDTLTMEQINNNLPVQVMCSWSNMAVLNPTAFLKSGVRFRRGKNQSKQDQKKAGECSTDIMFTMCMDFIKNEYNRHIMVPFVKTSMNQKTFLAGIRSGKMSLKNADKIKFRSLDKKVQCEPLYEDVVFKNEDAYLNDVA